MNNNIPQIPAEYVMPLNMNGLKGRMLRLKPKRNSKREFLIVYGHHSTLERWYALAQVINEHGGVTMPDLPGFGGMDSFYKIGEKPDLNTMADYLASFVKLRYKNRRVTLVGLSYGFLVVTRMLQRYPELTKKVDFTLSLVGFTHKDDFKFTSRRMNIYKNGAKVFSLPFTAWFFRHVVLHRFWLSNFYNKTYNAQHKFKDLNPSEREAVTEFEIHLWHVNDVRTYMRTSITMFTVNNCEVKIDLPVWHVGVETDNYFDKHTVEQHMKVIFKDFYYSKSPLKTHTPSIIAGKKETATLLPKNFRTVLRRFK